MKERALIAMSSCFGLFCSVAGSVAGVHLRIYFPSPGGLISQTFFPQFDIVVDGKPETFIQEHGNTARLCFAIGDRLATCEALDSPMTVVEDATPGPTVLKAWVADRCGRFMSDRISSVRFQVATDGQIARMGGKLGGMPRRPTADSLLEWHRAQAPQVDTRQTVVPQEEKGGSVRPVDTPNQITASCWDAGDSLLAVIGVKTAVGNFDRRLAIRDTWMRTDLGPLNGHACLRFITGQPGPELPKETMAALMLEASVYGDLLGPASSATAEADGKPVAGEIFDVRDDYDNLVAKTVGFMATAMEKLAHFQYLVMVDDDVYLRLDWLVELLEKRSPQDDKRGFYAGQVTAEEAGHDIRPQRYPAPKNALSKKEWPMDVLPRFAIGPLYILSRYCVEFIVANKSWLRGVGTLEDVSVGLWLLALQVHPSHLDNLKSAKNGCVEHAMSFAHIGPDGIRAVHSNLVEGRQLCHGFSLNEWGVA